MAVLAVVLFTLSMEMRGMMAGHMMERYDANKDGKIVCFYQSAQKFATRYGTLGFNDSANLDDGVLWPVAYAVKEMTATEETRIAELIKKAVS